jgi:putative salt-induced outer membrane protein YdiY
MPSIFRFLAALGLLVLATTSSADTATAPESTALPQSSEYPGRELPSEPWYPPGAPPAELPLPGATDSAAEASSTLIEPSPWYAPILWLGPTPWDSGVEVGLNGSSGTSDSISIRTGAYIKRESRFSKLDFSADYNLTMNGGKSTQNNAEFNVTHDWLIDQSSPWTLFAATDVFYDKFAAFDVQSSFNTGVGYRFVHVPELDFMTRVGGGASREFGGPDDRWVPESLLGFEYCQRITQTQKFYGKMDYYPEWDHVGEYRLVADTGWEIELVQPSNLSLKISASDRYDSTPDGVDPHLVNYSVVLLLKL